MYVTRAQSKSERNRALRDRFNQSDRASPARAVGVNLYVKNLDENADDDTLRALFSPFGTITSVVAMKDEKGVCKGFGFVSFQAPDEATKAVTEMHLKVVKGKPLYVGLAEKREARQERLRQRYSPTGGPGSMGGPGMGGPNMSGGQMGGPGMPGGGMLGGKGGKSGKPAMQQQQEFGGCPGMGGPGMGGFPPSQMGM
jgi:polyadenylate-binding protein